MAKPPRTRWPPKGRRVLANGRSAPAREPYATIRADLLGSRKYRRLSGAAMRVHLLLEANFDPNRELYLPQAIAVKVLRLSFSTVACAFAELERAGVAIKLQDGWRPGRMGGQAEGRAAVYDLPHRRGSPKPMWRQQGDPNLQGSWRIHSERLRRLAAELSNSQAKVFLWLHAVNRLDDGSLAQNEGRPTSADDIGIPRSTLNRILHELVERGKVEMTEAGAGTKPANYRLASAETKGVQVRRTRRKKSPATMVGRNAS